MNPAGMTRSWVLYRTGTYHAWLQGAGVSVCGQLNTAHLRESPAKAIVPDLTDKQTDQACAVCLRKLGVTRTVPGLLDQAKPWVAFIRLRMKRAHVRIPERDIADFAILLAEVGQPGDPEAREVFDQVSAVLLRPVTRRERGRTIKTVPHLRKALALIPPDAKKLQHLALTIRTWRRVTGREPGRDRFTTDRVIGTMLEVPDPEAYVEHLNARGLPHLAAMFHPNTLERAKRSGLRGVFWDGGEGWGLDDVEIIDD